MDQNPTMKLAGAAALLVALWVAIYWLWEPARSKEPGIEFERGPEVASDRAGGAGDRTSPPLSKPSRSDGASGASNDRRVEPIVKPVGIKPSPANDSGASGESPREASNGGSGGGGPDRAGDSEVAPTRPVSGKEGSGIVVKPPKFDEYRVESGDTFETIAKKRLGSSSLASAIARANPFVDPRRLRPGRVILIPVDPGNIQGRTIPAPGATPGEGWKVHVVRSGDTLSSISKQYYGTVARSKAIYEANRDRMKSEHELKLNLELLIPPAEDAPKTAAPAGKGRTADAGDEGDPGDENR